MEETLEISPRELQTRLTSQDAVALIDVREPEEFLLAHIEGAELIPMQTIPGQLQKLEGISDERSIALLCHHGVRSLNVAVWLRQRGIANCFSVAGGIDRWSREIDSSVPRY